MSRYTIPALDPLHEAIVCWDPTLETYSGRVLIDEGVIQGNESAVVFWVGTRRGEIQTTGELAALMAPYAEVPLETIAQLRIDRRELRCGPVPQRVEPLS